MQGNTNPRIIGACLLGFALVAGAYVLSDFGVRDLPMQQAIVIETESTPRTAIAVVDEDENGIEDWRDEFVTVDPINLDDLGEAYEPPTTQTGQFSLTYMEGFFRQQMYGPFARSQEEVLDESFEILKQEVATDKIYDTPDVTVLSEWGDEEVLTYANTIALAMINNNIEGAETESLVLQDILESGTTDRLGELKALSNAYQGMRDDSLATPVPAFLLKEHLDLINTFHAIHRDIDGMTQALDDPIVTFMRLKRYEDDATGLGLALENMYNGLLPHAELVGPEDPALVFVVFSPEFES